MKVTRHYASKKFTIEVTDKEMDAICFRLAQEQGYQEARGTFKCARLMHLMRTSLRNWEADWD